MIDGVVLTIKPVGTLFLPTLNAYLEQPFWWGFPTIHIWQSLLTQINYFQDWPSLKLNESIQKVSKDWFSHIEILIDIQQYPYRALVW